MSQTEYSFTLPIGFTDGDGALHRQGTMRLATARDEIEPLRDVRVRENQAYLSVLRLARVVTRLGDAAEVTPQLVEQLYSADFEHLQRLYQRVNAAQPPEPTPERPAGLAAVSDTALRWMLDDDPESPGERALAAERGSAAELARAGEGAWPEGLPIGLRREQERTRSREALMRSSAPPRRGRIEEGAARGGDGLSVPATRHIPLEEPALVQSSAEEAGSHLMRFSSQAPEPASFERPAAVEPQPLDRIADMEELCEELIARLRRELLVERERMGTLFGA